MDAQRIERWLLQRGAQQRAGEHAGAVAGWLDADGAAAYVYPEITGYYLQWLAWVASRRGPEEMLAARAGAAQRWLSAWIGADDAPPMRVYLNESPHDWRNDAVFCFDLAMALRGLASAQRQGLIAPDAALVDRLCAWLSRLVGPDGALDACLRHRVCDAWPQRWSTRRGAFLAKAAAGILAAASVLPRLPPPLLAAAERTFAASIDALVRAPHDETHPYLYAIEGFLSLPQRPDFATALPAIAEAFDARIAEAERVGRLPEVRGGEGPARLDIVAQALRAALLLAAHRPASPEREPRRRFLVASLVQHVAPGGALPFAVEATPPQHNVWTTMFAEQALALHELAPAERMRFAASPCIV
jgi:hypothetical protein